MSTQATVPIPQGATVGNPNAVPIPAGASIGHPEEGITYANDGSFAITPKEGESFEDTMNRAAEIGKSVSPEQIQSQTVKGAKEAPVVLAAAPAMGAIGTAAIAGTGEAGAMAGRITQAALQPIKDAIVEELPYLKSSPGLYVEHIAKQAIQWIIENPDKVLKVATSSGVLAAAAKVLLSHAF